MKVNFVTGNKLKFDIAQAFFAPLSDNFKLYQLTIDVPEIQADTVQEVAIFSAQEAVRMVGEPCIVSDAGLMIEALNGFPGPFLKYVNTWLGIEGYLNLLAGIDNRRAYFEDTLAVAFPDGAVKTFTRREYGILAEMAEESRPGWAANDLFIPDGYDIPLGKMSNEEQVAFWGDGTWPEIIKYLQNSERGL
jgi:XTP/dITP diphosphohydrolase